MSDPGRLPRGSPRGKVHLSYRFPGPKGGQRKFLMDNLGGILIEDGEGGTGSLHDSIDLVPQHTPWFPH